MADPVGETKTIDGNPKPNAADVATIQSYFDAYLPKELKKTFAPQYVRQTTRLGPRVHVWGCLTDGADDILITYAYDGVSITYHSHVTTRRGDTDRFNDVEVRVDGKMIYERC